MHGAWHALRVGKCATMAQRQVNIARNCRVVGVAQWLRRGPFMKASHLGFAAVLFGVGLLACGSSEQPERDALGGSLSAEGDAPSAEQEDAAACDSGMFATCTVDDEDGLRECVGVPGSRQWSACSTFANCRPDQRQPLCPGGAQERSACTVVDGQWTLDRSVCPDAGGSSSTPLVLSFDRVPVSFTHPTGSFDVVGNGTSVDTDWVSSATPWLAIDLDGNGTIDDGTELFGSMTKLPSGRRAEHGFQALAALDSDGDGRITRLDPAFARLVTWRDQNQDRHADATELTPLEAEGVLAIDLGFHRAIRCVGTACEVERASFEFRGARGVRTGDVVDVHFHAR